MKGRKGYLSTSDARENLAEIVNQVAYGSQRFILGRRGRAMAALIPIEDLRKLESLDGERSEEPQLHLHASAESRRR